MSKDNGTKAGGTLPMLEWWANATTADLAGINQAIADVEAEIAEKVGALRDRLASLQALRKVVELKISGPKPKGPPPKNKPAGTGPATAAQHQALDRRRRIAKLLGDDGPTPGSVIGNRLDIPTGSMGGLMGHEWFEATPQGYRLTATGRREALNGAGVAG